jgi:hypothetical protein
MRTAARIVTGVWLALACTGGAIAQQSQPGSPVAGQTRFRGTIDSVEGRAIGLTTLTGQHISIVVPPGNPVLVATAGKMSDVKPGSFIGSAARTLPDGTLEALEVHVFAPELKGTREGHYAWDLQPQSTMTNATVSEVVGASGRKLTVNYPGGQQTIAVPPNMQIVLVSRGDWSDVKKGAPAIIGATQGADGTWTATSYFTVGRNGVRPPM